MIDLPGWCLHLNVVGEFESFRDPESYAGDSVCYWQGHPSRTGQRVEARRRDTLALQVGGWAQGQHPRNGKISVPLKTLNYWKMDGQLVETNASIKE